MCADVAGLEEVVEEVAPELARDRAKRRGQVEARNLGVGQGVRWGSDELRQSDSDANDPGEDDAYKQAWPWNIIVRTLTRFQVDFDRMKTYMEAGAAA